MRIVVVSCPKRKPIQEIWRACQLKNWPDCPFPIDMLSPEKDIGWNANLIEYLSGVDDVFTLLLLDDHFIDGSASDEYTNNMLEALHFMNEYPDVGLLKVQAGNAASPEILFEPWTRIREYDRKPHPFKRTNLVPTLFRTEYLRKLSTAVLSKCGAASDEGRNGALCFEGVGTILTEDVTAFPERMFGIHRPNDTMGRSLLSCIANDGVREGHLQVTDEQVGFSMESIEGIERFR